MNQAIAAFVTFAFIAAIAPAQTLTDFNWTYTAQGSGEATYTFNGVLSGYAANSEGLFDITQATGTWSGTPDGSLSFALDSFAGTSTLDYPLGGPTTIPPQLYLFAGNGQLVVNGSSGTYSQPFGSGTFTEIGSNLAPADAAPWEPSDTVALATVALFGWQQ